MDMGRLNDLIKELAGVCGASALMELALDEGDVFGLRGAFRLAALAAVLRVLAGWAA